MALPLAAVPIEGDLDEISLQAIISAEGLKLTTDLEDYEKFRDYYEGDQALVFATDEFKERARFRCR